MKAWTKNNPTGFWVLPLDYEEADLAADLLPYWKGSTPASLPGLGPPTDNEDKPEHVRPADCVPDERDLR